MTPTFRTIAAIALRIVCVPFVLIGIMGLMIYGLADDLSDDII